MAAKWNDKMQIGDRMLFSNGESRKQYISGHAECLHLQQIFELLFCLKHFLQLLALEIKRVTVFSSDLLAKSYGLSLNRGPNYLFFSLKT